MKKTRHGRGFEAIWPRRGLKTLPGDTRAEPVGEEHDDRRDQRHSPPV